MGIKGIYKEIGPGKRVSLCKLAVETLEQSGRPLRVAIDVSIWQFQVQAAKGGANPAIRTLFYRLVRLLGLPIQPVFVFDGANKPAFKRNKRSGRGDGVARAMAKRLIGLFGFAAHDAPGEAEAECALLQQHGIVDAVLSEDVDTIMFGCTRTLRGWSADGPKGSKTPTHVTVYDSDEVRLGESGLDREGMVLVALMSGGDYLPEGVPGCGVKVACEAARGGFGRSLCRIKKSDSQSLEDWRNSLLHELRTNESGFFRTKHKALTIPSNFPNLDVLRYYTHPVVSQTASLERLREEISATKLVHVTGLRQFVGETFDWTNRIGAVKFIRVLAPSLLVQSLLSLRRHEDILSNDADKALEAESAIIRGISSRRSHFSTDATPELRISYMPGTMVGINLDDEPEEAVASYGRDGLALNSDDEFEEPAEGDELPKNGARKAFDPLQPSLVWVPQSVAKLGAPVTVEDWEEKQRASERSRLATKAPKRRPTKKPDMPAGALDKYVKITKAVTVVASQKAASPKLLSSTPKFEMPPTPRALLPALAQPSREACAILRSKNPRPLEGQTPAARPGSQTNPWTLASSQASPRPHSPVARHSPQTVIISSSPVGPPSSPPRPPVRRLPSPRGEYPSKVGASTSPTTGSRKTRPATRSAPKVVANGMQASIKSFGRLVEAAGKGQLPRRDAALGQAKGTPETIEIVSDDDGVFARPGPPPEKAPPSPATERPGSEEECVSSEERDHLPVSETGLKPRSTMAKVYVQRTSDVGYFREVEVTREEAERLLSAESRGCGKGGARRTAWRHSEVSVVDLTRDD